MFEARHCFLPSLFKLVNLAELMNEEATQQLQCVCCYSAEGHAHTHTPGIASPPLATPLFSGRFLERTQRGGALWRPLQTLTAHPGSRDDSSGPFASAAAGRKHSAKQATLSLLTAGRRSQQSSASVASQGGALHQPTQLQEALPAFH